MFIDVNNNHQLFHHKILFWNFGILVTHYKYLHVFVEYLYPVQLVIDTFVTCLEALQSRCDLRFHIKYEGSVPRLLMLPFTLKCKIFVSFILLNFDNSLNGNACKYAILVLNIVITMPKQFKKGVLEKLLTFLLPDDAFLSHVERVVI